MAKNNVLNLMDMSTKENREHNARVLFERAKTFKSPITKKFIVLDEYYHNHHYTNEQITELAAEKGWDFTPPALTDPYIQVESQIDPLRPEFTFKGRDDDMDSRKAKVRQKVVEFIIYNNRLEEMMPENERHLKKLGTAFWKVAFDGSITGPGFVGDITIGGPDPANMFPDPSAYCIDDCEYVDYAYRLHKLKARRTYNKPAQKKVFDELSTSASHNDTEIYTREQTASLEDDSYQVVEHWYRDDEGDIACSIQIEGKEVQWIKKYWMNTRHSGNKMYPFVGYYDIPDNKSFWGKGEIEPIIDLVDSADREFLSALLTDMLSAQDQIVREEGALKDGTFISNMPGAEIITKDNKINAVKRLGGLNSNINALNMIRFIQEKIQETNGNFDTNQGQEPVRVTTASGLAQLNEKASKRSDIKKADRTTGFRRLYELIDWTALEFYNQDRLILIRGKSEDEQDQAITFNSDNIRTFDAQKYTALMSSNPELIPDVNDQEVEEQSYYYPRIDTEIITTDGMKQSKAFMTQATSEITAQLDKPVTPAKAEILKSQIELMDLPNRQDINEAIDASTQQVEQPPEHPVDAYYNSLSPEDQQAFTQLPQEEQMALIQQGGNV